MSPPCSVRTPVGRHRRYGRRSPCSPSRGGRPRPASRSAARRCGLFRVNVIDPPSAALPAACSASSGRQPHRATLRAGTPADGSARMIPEPRAEMRMDRGSDTRNSRPAETRERPVIRRSMPARRPRVRHEPGPARTLPGRRCARRPGSWPRFRSSPWLAGATRWLRPRRRGPAAARPRRTSSSAGPSTRRRDRHRRRGGRLPVGGPTGQRGPPGESRAAIDRSVFFRSAWPASRWPSCPGSSATTPSSSRSTWSSTCCWSSARRRRSSWRPRSR